MSRPSRRPCLALPFTVLTERDTVRLVAGEDFRYTLTGPGLDRWLPEWLAGCDGRRTLAESLASVPEAYRATAESLADRLYGERVLIDAPAGAAHPVAGFRPVPEGSAPWGPALAAETQPKGAEARSVAALPVLCQDRLDYEEALRFNRRCLAGPAPWLWASTGAMGRAYVSPVFLPDAGPCLGCLLGHFRRLSPVPELYDALIEHARAGGSIVPVPFPEQGVAVVRELILWKVSLLQRPEAPPALYRLHVVEADTLEVSTHRVFIDPECLECGGRG
jgi:bacteriocin biosynthesis cyclodehydratase domain-containing protein